MRQIKVGIKKEEIKRLSKVVDNNEEEVNESNEMKSTYYSRRKAINKATDIMTLASEWLFLFLEKGMKVHFEQLRMCVYCASPEHHCAVGPLRPGNGQAR